MTLVSIIEKIVSLLKNDPSYRFKENYSICQLLYIVYYRCMQLLRGMRMKIKIYAKGLVFCGRSVVIEHGYMIKSGPNLILDDYVYINALSENGIIFGRNVSLGRGINIVCTGVIAHKGVGLAIGDYTGINALTYIGCQGGVKIGSNVIMGPGVRIFSENHNFSSTELPIHMQGETRSKVVIEDNCWIGAGVTILAGVTIGYGSVIAAGSIVTKSVSPYSVAVGIPARTIKIRKH